MGDMLLMPVHTFFFFSPEGSVFESSCCGGKARLKTLISCSLTMLAYAQALLGQCDTDTTAMWANPDLYQAR